MARGFFQMRKASIYILFIIMLVSNGRAEIEGDQIVISQRQIESIGNFRIGDIFRNIESTSFGTIDGFMYQFSFNGLNNYQYQDYAIYVNDHELSLGLLGSININSLPINTNNIDSVKIITTPRLYKGHFENNGIIQFYTSKPENEKYFVNNKIHLG